MEIQLQELIEQIKKDGVAAAEAEARAITDKANAEADRIIKNARAQADKIISDAKNESSRMTASGEDALRQAGRNLLISFRESVARELKAVTGDRVKAAYSPETISSLILKAVENWTANKDAENMTVILNTEDLKALEASLLSALKEKLTKGVTLKASDGFDAGFRISAGEDGAYYDYSADTVTDMISSYLSPELTALLKEAE